MRASEFLTEGEGKMHDQHSQATQGVMRVRDVGGYDRIYHMNRMGMAMAMADGKSHKPVDMDASSWTEKYNTLHPYTDEEENMIHQAMATIPTDHKHVSNSRDSKEPDHVHRISPVTGFKGYAR